MNSKLAACLVALALLVAWVFLRLAGDRGGTARGGEVALPAAAPEPDVLEPASEPAVATAPAAPVERVAAQPASDPTGARAWRSSLAGLMGRVVESDGKPVAGIRVSLLEGDARVLFDGSGIGAEPIRLELEETATDREGRFVLGGAWSTSFHGLGIDLGGPRATVRIVEQALVNGERTDIGDVVLAPFGVLTGRVVDENGAPVAGARVRAAPLPDEILKVPTWEFRSDSAVAVQAALAGGKGEIVIEPPDWIRAVIDRLPVPTTTTAADGRFRLEGVALAEVVGGVDKRGHVGVPLGPLDLTGGEKDVGELVLSHGRTVHGTVEDTFGEPVAGAEVLAGAEIVPGVAAILQPCGLTDEEGNFELRGVAPEGMIVAAARRAPHEPWGTVVSPRTDGVTLELEGLVQLTVDVRDGLGRPLSSARIELTPSTPPGMRSGMGDFFQILTRPSRAVEDFHEVEPGRYVNSGLAAGSYEVTVRVPGLAPGLAHAECRAEKNEVALVCPVGQALELSVVDMDTKAAVEGARASLLRTSRKGFLQLGAATTDGAGHARLGPISTDYASEPDDGFAKTMLLVQHPSYGDYSADVEPGATVMVAPMSGGGSLAGRVHWGGAVPTRAYMLTLLYEDEGNGFLQAFHLPRFALTGLTGEFRVDRLLPGTYRVELVERFLHQDPIGLMNAEFEPVTLFRQEVEVRAGATTQLEIDLTPTGRGATARIAGRVRVDGHNLEGATVEVRGNEDVKTTTDASGRFETPEFSALGSSNLTIEGTVRLGGEPPRSMELYDEWLQLEKDEVHEVDLDLYPAALRVRVVDGDGGPVAQAAVNATLQSGGGRLRIEGTTDGDGAAVVWVLKPGEYTVQVRADGFGRLTSKVDVPAEGTSEAVVLRLPRAVPCSGRIQIAAGVNLEGGGRFSYMQVRSVENGDSSWSRIEAPDYAFKLDGLGPGKYGTTIYLDGRQGKGEEFTLGPEGTNDLVLTFEPEGD